MIRRRYWNRREPTIWTFFFRSLRVIKSKLFNSVWSFNTNTHYNDIFCCFLVLRWLKFRLVYINTHPLQNREINLEHRVKYIGSHIWISDDAWAYDLKYSQLLLKKNSDFLYVLNLLKYPFFYRQYHLSREKSTH